MARNTFVFGIGGTGARVIRALTMLLASGAKLEHAGKVIPIIVDADAENEDTSRTIKALDLYKRIRNSAFGDNADQQIGFFGTPINTLNSQNAADAGSIQDGFQLKFAGISSSFSKYLKVHDMDSLDEEFLKLLYDSSPEGTPESELHLSLTKGFKGNPNIGCIVFNELENSPEFRYFQNAIGEGDRIFIVSSIFGGTGSAGFPQLLKLLKKSRNNRVSSARTGALTMMPYFAVQEDSNSAIDSNRFMSKTKAALSYYEQEMDSLDAMYYLYDKPGNTPYANNEGGRAQKNDAHIAELLAAGAILDFTNKREEDFTGTTIYEEYGVKKDDLTLHIGHFFDRERQNMMMPLTAFTYAAKAYVDHLPTAMNESFAKELDLSSKLQTSIFYQSLTAFFNQHFLPWLMEMGQNSRSFLPFHLRGDFNTLINSKPIKTGFFDKGISEGYLNTHFGKIENELQKTIPQGEKRFLMLLNEIAEKCFEKLEGLPTIA